jgi:hypothetical protein
MRRLLMLLVVCAASYLTGCGCPSTVQTADERNRRIDEMVKLQSRQIVDDWDYFWLCDKSTRLSQWDVWVDQ